MVPFSLASQGRRGQMGGFVNGRGASGNPAAGVGESSPYKTLLPRVAGPWSCVGGQTRAGPEVVTDVSSAFLSENGADSTACQNSVIDGDNSRFAVRGRLQQCGVVGP